MIIIKPKKQGRSRFSQKGFTLVELAIVLMIIGLLIGGVLRGQELLENARVSSTIEQVKAYNGAFTTFVDAYNNYPGDMSMATTRLPGCVAPCANGNGDSMVGTTMNIVNPIDATIASENTQFWNHLALAHLITGVVPNSTTAAWGQSHPMGKFGGGFFVENTNRSANAMSAPSHLFFMRDNIDGTRNCGAGTYMCAISAPRAAQIDRKMDDGIANTGDVVGWSYNPGTVGTCGVPSTGFLGPTGYAETITDKLCELYFVFK